MLKSPGKKKRVVYLDEIREEDICASCPRVKTKLHLKDQ